MSKVFLDEMTWREAQAAIERDAPVFLPTGPVEGHGPHVPLGCDSTIATAFSVILARKCGGLTPPSHFGLALTTAHATIPAFSRFWCYTPLESQLFQTVQSVRAVRTCFCGRLWA